jgi:hypothetical protein
VTDAIAPISFPLVRLSDFSDIPGESCENWERRSAKTPRSICEIQAKSAEKLHSAGGVGGILLAHVSVYHITCLAWELRKKNIKKQGRVHVYSTHRLLPKFLLSFFCEGC